MKLDQLVLNMWAQCCLFKIQCLHPSCRLSLTPEAAAGSKSPTDLPMLVTLAAWSLCCHTGLNGA